jgi:formylmethanofuran dehydrogenase subunit C
VIEISLTLKAAPTLRVDMRGITPASLAGADPATLAEHMVWHGNERLALADLFAVKVRERKDDLTTLRLVGDLARFDRIGWGMDSGRIEIEGGAGDYLGALMTTGEIHCTGEAGMFAACEMAGGRLLVDGNVGDFVASALPGSMDGMRGGEVIVRGDAGERLGDRMRRGLLAVLGNASFASGGRNGRDRWFDRSASRIRHAARHARAGAGAARSPADLRSERARHHGVLAPAQPAACTTR